MGFAIVTDTFTPKVGRWALMLRSSQTRQRFLMRWGATIRKRAMENARAKGGRRMWRDIARSVNIKAVDANSVDVSASHVAAAQKQFGGKIRARGKAAGGSDFLTIPVAPEAEGQYAGKFALPTARHPDGTGSHALFVFPNSNLLGYMDEGSFHALFALVRETKRQRPDPWWPESDYIEEQGIQQAQAVLGVGAK